MRFRNSDRYFGLLSGYHAESLDWRGFSGSCGEDFGNCDRAISLRWIFYGNP
jgi:hypothetical protein